MTVAELTYGRGAPMSAHELTVVWPLFWDFEARRRQKAQQEAEEKQRRSLK